MLGRCDRDPVMFVIIRQKYKSAGAKDDFGPQDNAIPLHHSVEIGLRAQHNMSEFTGRYRRRGRRFAHCRFSTLTIIVSPTISTSARSVQHLSAPDWRDTVRKSDIERVERK